MLNSHNISKIKTTMQRKFLPLIVLLCLGGTFAYGQMTSVKPEAGFSDLTTNVTTAAPADSDNWTLYADEENKLYYIDFESLSVNVSDVIVRNAQGEIVWQDKVFDLPVNTIYELDFSRRKSGTYEVELRTFTSVIRKTVVIK